MNKPELEQLVDSIIKKIIIENHGASIPMPNKMRTKFDYNALATIKDYSDIQFAKYVKSKYDKFGNVYVDSDPILNGIFKYNFNKEELATDGSGFNNNKYYKAHKNDTAALYDIWTVVRKKLKVQGLA
jgi:hypothetical protein